MVSGLLGNEIDTHRLAQILRSDLPGVLAIADDVQQLPQYLFGIELWGGGGGRYGGHGSSLLGRLWRVWGDAGGCRQHAEPGQRRSEEPTSELQSLMRISSAVFCLKKKNKHTKTAQ